MEDATEKLKAGEALGFIILWCGSTGGDSPRTAKSGAGIKEWVWGGRKAALAYSWRLRSFGPCSTGYSKTEPQPSSRLQPQLLKMKMMLGWFSLTSLLSVSLGSAHPARGSAHPAGTAMMLSRTRRSLSPQRGRAAQPKRGRSGKVQTHSF